MTCRDVRLTLSSILDGEDADQPVAAADTHLAECAECRRWRAVAERVTREVRIQEATEVPDLTERVLAAVHADPAVRTRSAAGVPVGRRRLVLRVAVAVTAVAQLLFSLPALVQALGGGGAHVGHEIGAFDLAVAVGFLLAAWRPEWARPLVPVAVVLSVGLLVTASLDVAHASTGVAHETVHLITVLQASLLWTLTRASGSRRGRATAGATV